MDKAEYRKKAKKIRKELDIDGISLRIQEKIQQMSSYIEAKDVMLYYPKEGELNLLGLAGDKKDFYLPRLDNTDILPCPWKCGDTLCLSRYKILEPYTEPVSAGDIDLIILPGLCADKNKNRLGYGKGCYDRFLEKCKAATIFAVPDELIFDAIPVEIFDKKADVIVSQCRIIL